MGKGGSVADGDQAPETGPNRLLRAILPLLAGLGPVIGVLALNPINRVYSHHGLIHTSITYRIFHTDLPPTHPFLGDQALPYYWGYHFLAAQLVSVGLAPSWAGVVINLVTLLGTMLAAWWIATQFLRKSAGARPGSRYWLILASAFGALFAPSFVPAGLWTDLVGVPLGMAFCDPRALPAAVKFVNQSGMPLGILCSLTWIASLIGYYQGQRSRLFAVGLGLSLLACAFFYPPMLPSLVLGTPVVAVLFIWSSAADRRGEMWKRGILICVVGAASVLLTFPYLLQVAESLRGNTKIFDLAAGRDGLIWAMLVVLPTLGYLYLRRHVAESSLERVPMLVFAGVFVSSLWLYLTLSQPLRTEYKYLSVAMIALGFVGGGLFAVAWCKRSVLSWVIAVAFLVTPTYSLLKKLNYHTDWGNKFEESGRDLLYTGDSQKGELFDWCAHFQRTRRALPRSHRFGTGLRPTRCVDLAECARDDRLRGESVRIPGRSRSRPSRSAIAGARRHRELRVDLANDPIGRPRVSHRRPPRVQGHGRGPRALATGLQNQTHALLDLLLDRGLPRKLNLGTAQ